MTGSAADLQREAESTRAGLSNTLDELRSSLTTAAITSGAMTIAKEGSTTLARVAVARARANPLAALLIGAGVMMMLNYDRDGSGQLVQRVASSVTGAVKRATSMAGAAAGDAVHAARAMSHDVADQARDAVDDAEETAAHVADRARHAVKSGVDKARGLATDAQGRASHLVDENRHYLTPGGMLRLAHEQPILVAAVGIAVGAAIGAALPLGKAAGRPLAASEGKRADGHAQPDDACA
ncbi:hypothetical protein [Reyranella sp.]|uniref:hypothetical protein n=1 Tax=Reyranella sp. TaxID=1929291 RepID=UPI003D0EBD49